MMRANLLFGILSLFGGALVLPVEAGTVTGESLHCEYLTNPQGIDAIPPRLGWHLVSQERGQRQTAYQVLVASIADNLANEKGDLWDSGKVQSDASVQVAYAGKPLPSRTRCYWKVRVWDKDGTPSPWSEPAVWTMGLLQRSDWVAKWIGMNPADGNAEYPRFRKTFVLDQPPNDARLYISSLGYHEVFVNGKKVTEDVLSPAVTQLDRRSLYLTYDVASLLRKGTNCIALGLGRGWYLTVGADSGVEKRPGYAEILHPEGPVALAQLEILTGDGKTIAVATDKSWRASASPFSRTSNSWSPASATTWAAWSLRYDARQEQPGWNEADYDDRRWVHAQQCDFPGITVSAQCVEPNRIIHELSPKSVKPCGKGAWLIDLGTNLTGWLKLRVRGPYKSGHKIQVIYGDHLDETGEPVGCNDFDEYVAAGRDDNWFCCRFASHGFRYAKVSGLLEPPHVEDIVGCLIRTAYAANNSFACSNPRLTAIHDMVARSFQCLSLGGYIYCDACYERQGYGGDGQSGTECALMMYPMGPLYRSWMQAWRDCQRPDGDMPHTAPSYRAGGGPYWSGIIIAASWYVYQHYGDRKLLEADYPAMQKWLKFFDDHCTKSNLFDGWPDTDRRNWCLGDWAVPKDVDHAYPPSVNLVNNCYRIYCHDLMAQIAAVLDRPADAAHYRTQADLLRPIVHNAFYDRQKKTYAAGGQLDLAFPLLVRVVPEELRADILRQLEQDIVKKRHGHIAVGLVGVPILIKTLMELDRNDLIFTFANKDTYPSWGYMLKNGATTTWEYWSGERAHICNLFNGIGTWFYQAVGGIQLDLTSPGFKHFVIKPVILGDITWAKTQYNSIRGPIAVDWKRENGQLEINVRVPANATATVFVPTHDVADVLEGDMQATKSKCVGFRRMESGAAVFDVDSGSYHFLVRPNDRITSMP